ISGGGAESRSRAITTAIAKAIAKGSSGSGIVTSTSASSIRGSESIQSSRNRGIKGAGSGRDVRAHSFLVDRGQRAVGHQFLQDRVDLGDQVVLPLLHDHADGDVGGQCHV